MTRNHLGAHNFDDLVGLTAVQLVARLPALCPDVSQFTFTRYAPQPGAATRLAQTSVELKPELEALLLNSPLVHRRAIELLMFVSAADVEPERALDALLSQDDADEGAREFRIDAHRLAADSVQTILSETPTDKALGLSSLCALKRGGFAHLPLVDFCLAATPDNQQVMIAAARRLGLKHAAVLESGRSYHVYGFDLMTEPEWARFLARALLLTPIVDVRYIAHRLLARRSVLRINSSVAKPEVPLVVAAF